MIQLEGDIKRGSQTVTSELELDMYEGEGKGRLHFGELKTHDRRRHDGYGPYGSMQR
jgi:hypothetical protein